MENLRQNETLKKVKKVKKVSKGPATVEKFSKCNKAFDVILFYFP